MKATVIGLGLIGGSFALSLKEKGLCDVVTGIEHSPSNAQKALELGLVERIVTIDEAIAESDLIVLATPVDTIPIMATKILNRISEKQIVMDMGSTKQELCEITMLHPRRGRLVATHPMWGTENSGPEAAEHNAFKGRTVVICEKEQTDSDALQLVEHIYQSLGMPIRYMSAEEQDTHCAYVSHISHITSFALALTVLEKEREE
jgi:prephenate dehydrogenase